MGDQLRDTHLRWFGHVQCKPTPVLEEKFLQVGQWPLKEKGVNWRGQSTIVVEIVSDSFQLSF